MCLCDQYVTLQLGPQTQLLFAQNATSFINFKWVSFDFIDTICNKIFITCSSVQCYKFYELEMGVILPTAFVAKCFTTIGSVNGRPGLLK